MINPDEFGTVEYDLTHTNLDKKHSILPTIMNLLSPLEQKVVLDVGCGDGFFTIPIANQGAKHVYGIDSSYEQIARAKCNPHPKVDYHKQDMNAHLPKVGVINAPFVLNYSASLSELEWLLANFGDALPDCGKLVSVIDLPKLDLTSEQRERIKQLSVVKSLPEGYKDCAPMVLDFYNGGELSFSVDATYFSPRAIRDALRETGFGEPLWTLPIVEEGSPLEKIEDYQNISELLYFVAWKMPRGFCK